MTADVTSTVAQPAAVAAVRRTATSPTTKPSTSRRAPTASTSSSRRRRPGFLRFRVAVEAARDTFNQNDRADANTIVKGEPRVLVVKGDEDVAQQLVTALRDASASRSTP